MEGMSLRFELNVYFWEVCAYILGCDQRLGVAENVRHKSEGEGLWIGREGT